jgi:hypothetical protein
MLFNVIVPALQALAFLCHIRAAQTRVKSSTAWILAVVPAVCDLFSNISRTSSCVLVSAGVVPCLLEGLLTRARVAGDTQVAAVVETLLQEL